MKYVGIGCIMFFLITMAFGILSITGIVGTLNNDATLKNRVAAQVDVRDAHFDKMFKVIAQRAQITKASSEVQVQLVESLVKGRAATFIKVVQEANPESAFDRSQFTELANSVEAQREDFFREQKLLIDLVREHHTLHDSFPSGFILSFAGRQKVAKPIIITSDTAKEAASSGSENEIELEL